MWKMVAAALIAVSMLSPVAAEAAEKTYKTEKNAIKYCQGDTVVWVNTNSGIYHFADSSSFGNTKDGVFMCKEAADRAGYRASKTR